MEYTGKIYSLTDKHGNVFYIGCTVNHIEARLRQHVSEAMYKFKKEQSTKSIKEQIIIDSDFQISATILEIITITADSSQKANHELSKSEKAWIDKYIDLGYALANKEYRSIKKLDTVVQEYVGLSIAVSNRKMIVSKV